MTVVEDRALREWCDLMIIDTWATNRSLRGLAVVTPDGFEVAALVDDSSDVRKLAAIASSLHAVAHAATVENRLGAHRTALVEADNGILAITAFRLHGQALLLVQLGTRDAMPGTLYVNARDVATRAARSKP